VKPIPDRLKELFRYDSETGHFHRLKSSSVFCNTSLSEIAGGLDGLGYIRININGAKYRAHRLAWLYMFGKWPVGQIDHINGNRSDNRIANLREVTRAENIQNQLCPRKDNRSGYLGVSKMGKKFKASIGINGTKKYLGSYRTPEEASEVYQLAKEMLHVSQPCAR
jgi:hypothetical protein